MTEAATRLQGLADRWRLATVFAGLGRDPVFDRFTAMLANPRPETAAAFARELYGRDTVSWHEYLEGLVFCDENCLVRIAMADLRDHGRVTNLPKAMGEAAAEDLLLLGEMAAVGPDDLPFEAPAAWAAADDGASDLGLRFLAHLDRLGRDGYGMYARHRAFRLVETSAADKGYRLVPVEHPDPVTFEDLFGYEAQHEAVVENTRYLLEGLPAANVLLYGDAGTGKSATVKATANLLAPEGLRLVEVSKGQLHLLPGLLDELGRSPMRFVVFIDDLSFSDSDDDFAALKAVLEGGVSARADNTAIYATSNRRHIVRETFSARAGDEVHRTDAMEETVSLSERFGLRVSFDKPGKQAYLKIVHGLARDAGLELPVDELDREAERFALRKAGRSARAARQVVDALVAKERKGAQSC